MSRSDDRADEAVGQRGHTARAGEWVTESAFWIALALFGFVLLLFALGQAVGVDFLGTVADALGTRLGCWLAVALFALLLIVVAIRGFGARRSREPVDDRERNH